MPAICFNPGWTGVEIESDLHALRDKATEEGSRGAKHFVDFENLRLPRFMPREDQELPG
jgi:hypothetical protein